MGTIYGGETSIGYYLLTFSTSKVEQWLFLIFSLIELDSSSIPLALENFVLVVLV
jgi:hypothetical protein